jgi:uncharacterized membrane protein
MRPWIAAVLAVATCVCVTSLAFWVVGVVPPPPLASDLALWLMVSALGAALLALVVDVVRQSRRRSASSLSSAVEHHPMALPRDADARVAIVR